MKAKQKKVADESDKWLREMIEKQTVSTSVDDVYHDEGVDDRTKSTNTALEDDDKKEETPTVDDRDEISCADTFTESSKKKAEDGNTTPDALPATPQLSICASTSTETSTSAPRNNKTGAPGFQRGQNDEEERMKKKRRKRKRRRNGKERVENMREPCHVDS